VLLAVPPPVPSGLRFHRSLHRLRLSMSAPLALSIRDRGGASTAPPPTAGAPLPPLPRTLYTWSFSPPPPPPIAQNPNSTSGAAATIPINLLPHVARTGPSLRYRGRLVGPPSFGHGLMDSDTITSRERTTVQGRRRANEPGHVRSRTNDVGVL
jgi:hypothetical protein